MRRTTPPGAVSLIISSRDRADFLVAAVESVLAGHVVPDEVVVVDQSATADPRLEALAERRPGLVRYLWTRSVGLSRGNNAGVAAARGNRLVFTHDDVLVDAHWLERLLEALEAGGHGTVVTGRVLPTEPETASGFAPTVRLETEPATYRGRVWTDILYPLNMAMHRESLERVGGFDERLGPGTAFPAAEDNDLGFRLLEAGHRIVYVPEAVVFHRAWRTDRDHLALRWSYGRGQGAYYAKHLSLRDGYMARRFARDILKRVVRFPYRLLRNRRMAWSDAAFALGMLSGASQWLVSRRRGG